MEEFRLLALSMELRALVLSYVIPSTIDLDHPGNPICVKPTHLTFPYGDCFGLTPTCRSTFSVLFLNKQLRNEMILAFRRGTPDIRFRKIHAFNRFIPRLAKLQLVSYTKRNGVNNLSAAGVHLPFTFSMVLHANIAKQTFQTFMESPNHSSKKSKHRNWLMAQGRHGDNSIRISIAMAAHGPGYSVDRSIRLGIAMAAHDEGFSVNFGDWFEVIGEHVVTRNRLNVGGRDVEQDVRRRGTLSFQLYARSAGSVILESTLGGLWSDEQTQV